MLRPTGEVEEVEVVRKSCDEKELAPQRGRRGRKELAMLVGRIA